VPAGVDGGGHPPLGVHACRRLGGLCRPRWRRPARRRVRHPPAKRLFAWTQHHVAVTASSWSCAVSSR